MALMLRILAYEDGQEPTRPIVHTGPIETFPHEQKRRQSRSRRQASKNRGWTVTSLPANKAAAIGQHARASWVSLVSVSEPDKPRLTDVRLIMKL